MDTYSVDPTYFSDGVIGVTSPLGAVTWYMVNGLNNSAKQTQVARVCASCASIGGLLNYNYDANGNVAKISDFNGNVSLFTYDLTRNLETSRTLASGTPQARTISTTWHPTYRLPTKIKDGARTFTYGYDSVGNLLSATLTDPTITSTWGYTYNGAGQVLTATDPRGNKTSYVYDTLGRVTSVTNALGQTTKITAFDANSRPTSITDPNGLVTTLAYNFRGQITSRVVGGLKTTLAYDPVGQLTKLTRPDSSYFAFTWDPAHRLVGIADPVGDKVVYTLDAAGNRIKEQIYDPSGTLKQIHSRVYDGVSRLSQDIGALGQTSKFTYDFNDNPTGFVDPDGNASSTVFDGLNRVTQITDAIGAKTNLGYDANGRLASVTDPRGQVTNYANNGLDERATITSPDTGATAKTFDAAGNMLTSTDARGQTTSYAHDALNRRVQATYADGSTANYGYDQGAFGIDRLTSMSDWTGTTNWTYDAYGHVVQKTQTTGGVTLTTAWSYNAANGLLVSVTYPSGYTILYAYDADARVSAIGLQPPGGAISMLIGSIAYAPFGSVASWSQNASGGAYSRAFDQDGRIASITTSTGAALSYAYDAGSRTTSITESGLATKSFAYDQNDRLTGYAYGPATQSYAYDLSGNRTGYAATGPAPTSLAFGYDTASNRLLTVSGSSSESYSYDAAGNTTVHAPFATEAYDTRGRLAQVAVGALATSYGVNALGQRVYKNGPASGAIEYAYDLSGRLLGAYGPSGAAQEEIIWLGPLPIASLQGGAVYSIAPDHLSASHQIVNSANQQVWFWDHDPFGQGAPAAAAGVTHNLRFPGQIYDAETGLHYNGARDYSPALGRYVESDPIGLAGGVNTYAYAGNNPLRFVDPFGTAGLPTDIVQDPLKAPEPETELAEIGKGLTHSPNMSPIPLDVAPAGGCRGRLGGAETRAQNARIAAELESQGYTIIGGGGRLPEEYIPGAGPGTRGSTYVDITAQNGATGAITRVQTIDTLADGSPTAREAAAAAKIQSAFPNDTLQLIPK